MKLSLKAFLNELAKKAGLEIDNDNLVAFIANNKELDKIEVPEELDTAFASLISVEDAKKNHPEIKRHYLAETMANVDRSLKQIYTDNPDIFDDDVIAELNGEKSSTKRIALVVDKLKAKKTDNKNDDEKSKALQAKIDDLNRQLAAEKEARANDVKSADQKFKQYRIDSYIDSTLMATKTIYDDLGPDAKRAALRALLDAEITQKGLILDIDDKNVVSLKNSDGTNYFDDKNKQVTPVAFSESLFAQKGVLQQTNKGGSGDNNQQNRGGQQNRQTSTNVTRSVSVEKNNEGGGVKRSGNIRNLTTAARESLKNPNPVNPTT